MMFVTANGATLPALGFGTFRMSGADTERMVAHVLNNGYRHIDTAQIYGNEAAVGTGIRASGAKRADLFLTTKVWVEQYRRADFLASVDESLKKLQTDHVDLLLLHWPSDAVGLDEQIDALNAVAAAGKARHIGVSNFTVALMDAAARLSPRPLANNQIEHHPYLSQAPVIAAAKRLGLSLTGYYAMADGAVLSDPALQALAASHGRTVPQIVLRWVLQQGMAVLSKTVSETRAIENAAVFDFALSDADMATIHSLARPDGRLVNPAGLAPTWD